MTYGHPEWSGNWVLAEEEASKHIKAACVNFPFLAVLLFHRVDSSYDYGINAFDTANVCMPLEFGKWS
jgi:hypothetical protein